MRAYGLKFTRELAQALNVSPARIEVVDTSVLQAAGQVVIEFNLLPGASGGEKSAASLRRLLQQQMNDGAVRFNPFLKNIDLSIGLREAASDDAGGGDEGSGGMGMGMGGGFGGGGGSNESSAATSLHTSKRPSPKTPSPLEASAMGDVLKEKEMVMYTYPDGRRKAARVLKVHTDEVPPYYTILLDGVEKGTERNRLSRPNERPPVNNHPGGAAAAKHLVRSLL